MSSRTIKIDSILIQKKKVTLFANEALEDIPFREYNVSELYASIAPLFPNASKIVILTRDTDIEIHRSVRGREVGHTKLV